MNGMLYQHVLFKDLQDYLRRSDYFASYTDTEKEWIRKNLNISSLLEVLQLIDDLVSGFKEVSYKTLSLLIRDKKLIPGYSYVILDFLTIYSSPEKNSNGKNITWGGEINPSKVYNLIVTAASNSTLLSNVAVLSDDPKSLIWEVLYDPTSKILPDGKVTMGSITYLKDENGNIANFDFKNVKGKFGYTFKSELGNENSQNCYNNNVLYCSTISFTGNSSHNFIKGQNIHFEIPVNNVIGTINNIDIKENKIDWDSDNIKQCILTSNKLFIDCLDQETLTHLLYDLENL